MYSETEIGFNSAEFTLFGTLCLPNAVESPPLVLFIHGSGPLDRDENSKFGKLNAFNTLAHQLAELGVASFRYDKRGCGKSQGNYHKTGHFELVDDTEAAFEHFKNNSPAPLGKQFICGHSEGTIIAPQVSNRRQDVDGIILIAPFLKPLDEVMMAQANSLAKDIAIKPGLSGKLTRFIVSLVGGVKKQQQKVVEKLKNSTTDTIRVQFMPTPARWFRELSSIDPRAIYEQVDVPTYILAGDKDLQCAPEDAREIAQIISEKCQLNLVEDLTHILRRDANEASFLAYKKLMKQPIDPDIAPTIAKWILEQNQT